MTGTCWLCLGCNHETAVGLSQARSLLTELFPDIRFGTEQRTAPIDFPNSSPFVNQVACFHTTRPIVDILPELKDIEHACGRREEEKKEGIVRMDIDLLQYGSTVLKPQDMEYVHVKKGMKELLFHADTIHV
ncbi:MAG: 2-amino-4-hydroxy-6-hydroxymethyldihydropteridine diphosphokinase [Paraprevotella sp.]|nr:2-amino-4-hydroxy-6-hydroxymethyldihydropteridine diphosphokinase [Paraprevotella sp.]